MLLILCLARAPWTPIAFQIYRGDSITFHTCHCLIFTDWNWDKNEEIRAHVHCVDLSSRTQLVENPRYELTIRRSVITTRNISMWCHDVVYMISQKCLYFSLLCDGSHCQNLFIGVICLQGRTSYCKISRSLDAARFGYKLFLIALKFDRHLGRILLSGLLLLNLKGPPQGKCKIFKSAFPMPYLYHEVNRIIHARYIHW